MLRRPPIRPRAIEARAPTDRNGRSRARFRFRRGAPCAARRGPARIGGHATHTAPARGPGNREPPRRMPDTFDGRGAAGRAVPLRPKSKRDCGSGRGRGGDGSARRDRRPGVRAGRWFPAAAGGPGRKPRYSPGRSRIALGSGSNENAPGFGPRGGNQRIHSMVGATGFEPATTSTPRRCATGLRYAPTSRVDGVRDDAILHELPLLGQGDSERRADPEKRLGASFSRAGAGSVHAPMQDGEKSLQVASQGTEHLLAIRSCKAERDLFTAAAVIQELPSCAGDREALVVEELFVLDKGLHLMLPVQAPDPASNLV